MGGRRSGRSGWRGVLDCCRRLDVNRFHREGYIGRRCWTAWEWRDDDGDVSASIGIAFEPEALELSYTAGPGTEEAERVRHRIGIDWTPCHYGGQRPWFLCRRCGRRVGKLYLWGRYFVCRHCAGAAYASQNETESDRLYRKARAIRRRLGASTDLSAPVWQKPKGMHWRTFERLREEAEEADHRGLLLAFTSLRRRFGYGVGGVS